MLHFTKEEMEEETSISPSTLKQCKDDLATTQETIRICITNLMLLNSPFSVSFVLGVQVR
ncbi:hypothetical protein ACRRTK_013030 [Alexandromys fortis]